jgi:hypothetical protein
MQRDLQARIDENRGQTRALLNQRLQKSIRQQGLVAQKMIAKRQAMRYLRNTMIATPILLGCTWFAFTALGWQINRADPLVQVAHPVQPQPAKAASTPPAAPALEPSLAEPGDETREVNDLRFDRELNHPDSPKASTTIPQTTLLENQK